MATPRERLESEIKSALKGGDRERVATLRLLLAAVDNERIRSGEPVDEPTFLGLVQKGIKQRRESSEQYRKGDSEELAAKEDREAEILEGYLPPPVSQEELADAIRQFTQEAGLSGPGAMGPIMRAMLERFAGRADGGTISQVARKVLEESS
jgi:uncharacterized protein YqeY